MKRIKKNLWKNLRVYSYSKNSKYVAFDYCEDHGEAYETNKEKFMEEFKNYFENKF